MISGCYKIPNLKFTAKGVFTNKMSHGRDPRRRPARGDAPDRDDGRPARARARHGLARAAAQELHPARRTSRPRWPSASSTTRATTTGRSTSCSSNLDLDALPARAGGAASQGHLPRDRVLHLDGDLRPRAVARGRARAASACRPASGSRRSCACTRPARRPSTPAPRRTARASTRAFAQIVADRLGITPDRSTSSTATPAPGRSASAPTARARWPSAASRSRARP